MRLLHIPQIRETIRAVSMGEINVRRNLVIVRAGDRSLHPGWLAGERNWDAIINYYGDDPCAFRSADVCRIDSKGPKWPSLYELIGKLEPELEAYDYVWLPDDDLASDTASINTFFDICHEFALDLAQPALTLDSIIGNPITMRNRSFRLRFTNFVEIMGPAFSRAFLKRCHPSFNANISGYGLDFLWPTWVEHQSKAAIIDSVPVRHTRSRGVQYDTLKAIGLTPEQEFAALIDKEKLLPLPMTLGGIDLEGNLHAVWNKGHQQLIRHMLKGYLPELADKGELLYQLIAPILVYLGGEPTYSLR